MGGKGGFGKSLANKGRAYRFQRSKAADAAAAAGIGSTLARDLDGKRLGGKAAAAVIAQEAARRERKVKTVAEQQTGIASAISTIQGRKRPSGAADEASGTDSHASDDESEYRDAEAEAAQLVQDQMYLDQMKVDLALIRNAAKLGVAILQEQESSKDANPTPR